MRFLNYTLLATFLLAATLAADEPPEFAPQNMEIELWQKYLDAGGDIDAKDHLGRYPILLITERNIPHQVKICEFLLEKGINVNREATDGQTPLYRMIVLDNGPLAAKILAAGADPNHVAQWGETPLMAAARLWEHDLCVKLAEAGAELDAVDEFGESAMHHAARAGNVRTCVWLLELGLDADAKSYKGLSPVTMAAVENELPAVRFLLEAGAKLPAEAEERDLILAGAIKKPLLHLAAERGNLEMCKLLVRHGARFLDEPDDKEKLLHAAVRSGSVDMCRYVVNFNPDVDVQDGEVNLGGIGYTPLYYAAMAANYDLCVFLLSRGADVNGKTEDALPAHLLTIATRYGVSKSPLENLPVFRIYDLLLAAEKDRERVQPTLVPLLRGVIKQGDAVLKYLSLKLEIYGADDKPAPLLLAAYAGDAAECEKLLKAGADINTKDADGETALHYAIRGNQPEVCKLLLERGADKEARGLWGGTAMHYAAMCGCPEIIKLLAKNGVSLDAGDTVSGETPLHWAVRASQGTAVVALVKAGTKLTGNEYGNESPFALALRAGKEPYCTFLAQNGYDLNAEMEHTPLRKLLVGMRLTPEKLEILRKCGLDFNRQDADGDTMLHYAARFCDPAAMPMILAQGADTSVKNKKGETVFDILRSRNLAKKERVLFGETMEAR